MSVATAVFNRSTLKLLLALAIPGSIAYFFWYSEQQANLEIQRVREEERKNPVADRVVINNYGMKEIDDNNNMHWQLTAKSGSIQPNGQDVDLTGVEVKYFDPTTHGLKMRLVAPAGTANQVTKYVKLKGANGQKVLAEGEGGKSKFEANAVELTKSNQFVATGGVIIEWPGVAKVRGDSAAGSTNLGAGPKDFKVVGHTDAEIAVH